MTFEWFMVAIYPIITIVTAIIDYKVPFLFKLAYKEVINPTERQKFGLILQACAIEYFMLFAGLYLGSLYL